MCSILYTMLMRHRNAYALALTLMILLGPLLVHAAISPELQKYINKINARAAAIAIRSRRVLPVAYNGTCPILASNLSFGMQGADVRALQTFLISHGALSSDSATGYFGKLTQSAVQDYQLQQDIISSGTSAATGFGKVGPKTRASIAEQCKTTTLAAAQKSPIPATVSPTDTSVVETPSSDSIATSPLASASAVQPLETEPLGVEIPSTVVTEPTVVAVSPPPTETPSAPADADPEGTIATSSPESSLPDSYITCGTIDVSATLHDQGYAYVLNDFVGGGDTTENPEASNVVIYENGLLIGPGNSSILDVRDLGDGRFSHSSDGQSNTLYFSASDNSDPMTSGKAYTYGVSSGTCPQ